MSRQSDSWPFRHSRRVKSKPTRHAGRVEDDSVARKRRTVLSLAVDEMASSVPPSSLVSLAPGEPNLV
jgi:hypothetical protein